MIRFAKTNVIEECFGFGQICNFFINFPDRKFSSHATTSSANRQYLQLSLLHSPFSASSLLFSSQSIEFNLVNQIESWRRESFSRQDKDKEKKVSGIQRKVVQSDLKTSSSALQVTFRTIPKLGEFFMIHEMKKCFLNNN